jgi:hypothetical protein
MAWRVPALRGPAAETPERGEIPAQVPDACRTQLNGLAEALAHLGLRVSLLESAGSGPSLHVVNPEASVLAEDVYVTGGQDGGYSFWWSWSERIAAGDDLKGAAALIKRVLAARG